MTEDLTKDSGGTRRRGQIYLDMDGACQERLHIEILKKDPSLEKMNGSRCKWKRGLQTGGGTERESEYHRNQENVQVSREGLSYEGRE